MWTRVHILVIYDYGKYPCSAYGVERDSCVYTGIHSHTHTHTCTHLWESPLTSVIDLLMFLSYSFRPEGCCCVQRNTHRHTHTHTHFPKQTSLSYFNTFNSETVDSSSFDLNLRKVLKATLRRLYFTIQHTQEFTWVFFLII